MVAMDSTCTWLKTSGLDSSGGHRSPAEAGADPEGDDGRAMAWLCLRTVERVSGLTDLKWAECIPRLVFVGLE